MARALDCWPDCRRSPRCRGNQGWKAPQRRRDHQRRHRSHRCHPRCLRWLPLRLLWLPLRLLRQEEAEAEPEADPALVYSTGLVGYPYAVGAHAVTYAGAPHAVAYTPFGVTHSSNVGICTNNLGAVVPCRRKREADPALVYAGVGAVPYTYGVLPYAGVHGTNPVHAVAHTAAGLTHSSNVGICTNYVGAVVPC